MPDGCRMAACDAPPDQAGFCTPHLLRFAHEPLWVPVAVIETEEDGTVNRCGLCGTLVWTFRRTGEAGKYVILERDPHPDGGCEIVDGGFRMVVSAKMRKVLAAQGVPFYRPHAPSCPKRPRLLDIVL